MSALNFNITEKFELGKVCDLSFSQDGTLAIVSDNTEAAKLLYTATKKAPKEIHDKNVNIEDFYKLGRQCHASVRYNACHSKFIFKIILLTQGHVL